MTVSDRTAGPVTPDRTWPTRAALLTDLAEALPAAEREAFSLRRLLLGALPCAVATVAVLGMGAADGSAAAVAAWAVVGVLAVAAALAVAVRGSRARQELRRWDSLEVHLRHLPPGALPRELRTPFDAREDDDLDDVGRDALGAEYGRAFGTRVLLRGLASGFAVAVGLAVLVSGLLADPTSEVERASQLVGGVLGLAAGWHVGAAAAAHGYRSTLAWRRLGVEVDRWKALQAVSGGRAPEPQPAGRPRLALAVLALPFLLLLVARMAYASAQTVVVTAAMLVVVVGLLARPWLVARLRGRRLRAGGPGALVRVDVDDLLLTSSPAGSLLLGDRPLSTVTAATAGQRGSPTGPVVVDLLHADRTWTTVETREPQRLDAVLAAAGLPRY